MGCSCCCWPRSEELEGYALHSREGACHHCICLSCCWTRFFSTQVEGNDSSSVVQESGSSTDELLVVTSSDSPPHVYHTPPNQLTYDINQSGIDPDEQGVNAGISRKVLPPKATGKVDVKVIDEEDVCPTCFEGYDEENPKISTGCGHDFHLSCIYEWMERSIHCPVCYKEMVFSETP